ncbi:MAG: DNA replication complex GINS family protein [archaeon]|nr:DNA replication complex GINS family protein [archaeon]
MVDSSENITVEYLSSTERAEERDSSLSTIRKDFYSVVPDHIIRLRGECNKLILSTEGMDVFKCAELDDRCKKMQKRYKHIIDLRMRKITNLALRNAMGSGETISGLTPEEQVYYETVYESASKMYTLTITEKDSTPNDTVPAKKLVQEERYVVVHVTKDATFSWFDRDYKLMKEDVTSVPASVALILLTHKCGEIITTL